MEKNCIFCEIICGDKPADFVYQGDSVVAFKDRNPHAPVHLLIVPRDHIRSINDLTDGGRPVVAELILRARLIAEELGIARTGYRLPDKDFGLRYRSESSTTYLYARLTRIPPSGLAKIII